MKIKLLLITIIFTSISFNLTASSDLSLLTKLQKIEFNELIYQLKAPSVSSLNINSHVIKEVNEKKDGFTLEDGSQWSVNWWYRPVNWEKGSRIYIKSESGINNFYFQHTQTEQMLWGSFNLAPKVEKSPKIKLIESTILLTNGMTFSHANEIIFKNAEWKKKDKILILQNSQNEFQLWNLDKGSLISNCKLTRNVNPLLDLESNLNKRVIQQEEACLAVSNSILSYSAGLKPKEKPIGVFLFLGPTGVGKTELAKALTEEYYNDQSRLIRFDMSHFSQDHTVERLIGSPPGYKDHDNGGQLTNAIRAKPQSIVLLDEIEKAHDTVRKFFLPVFDEGYILDNNNEVADCSRVIFIMTSNICGLEIAKLYNAGLTHEEILEKIEPSVIEKLSPELYNRVEPVLFRPLNKEAIARLVDLMLNKLCQRIYEEKAITLHFDSYAKKYLAEFGYHPTLGARPLERLIDKKVVTTLAYAIVKNELSSGCSATVYYDFLTDTFYVKEDQ